MNGLSARGLVRGTLASVAGLAAMGLYFRAVSAMSNGSDDSGDDSDEKEGPLDDVAILKDRSREDESATQTLGRLAHEKATGREPDEARRKQLGQAVHWGYGMLVGGLYGAIRHSRERDGLDLGAGLGYGTALWLLGDEIAVPVLGLAKGPTAHPASTHVTTLGAHLVYGAATAAANRALTRVM